MSKTVFTREAIDLKDPTSATTDAHTDTTERIDLEPKPAFSAAEFLREIEQERQRDERAKRMAEIRAQLRRPILARDLDSPGVRTVWKFRGAADA